MSRYSLLCALALLGGSASAQLPLPPADSTLAGITARGRLLQQYDIATWHAGDAFEALKTTPGEVTVSFARRGADGSWEVSYGRLSAAKDTFYLVYRGAQTDRDSAFSVSKLRTPAPSTAAPREMALAIETATKAFGPVNRAYNSYILPAQPTGYWVYFLPAQTSTATFPFGGDVRYRIVGGTTIVDSVRFHKAVLERNTGRLANGGLQVASGHTSFDSLPSETDVFVVLRQTPHLPELVATRNFHFEISISGSITWVRANATAASAAIAPQPVTPSPGHIPVWPVKIDTVGSALRTMSPGYTEWRDTTTGWRMTFDHLFPVQGGEATEITGGWKILFLPNGSLLLTRSYPAGPIQMYDAKGAYVRDIGRVGGGPGEYLSTPTLTLKGDTLIAFDGMQGKMMLLTLSGDLIRSFQIPIRSFPTPIGIDPRGNIRVQQRFGFGQIDTLSRMQWRYYTTSGVLVDSLQRPSLPAPRAWNTLDGTRNMSFGVPYTPSITDVFLADGTLMYGVGDRFQFLVTRTGRDTARIFGRSDVKPVPLSPAYVDSIMTDILRTQPALKDVMKSGDFPTNFPLWNSATVDDHGYIWISQGISGRGTWNVGIFAPDGRFLGKMPIFWPNVDVLSFGGDRAAEVRLDANRKPVVRIYQIDRRGMP